MQFFEGNALESSAAPGAGSAGWTPKSSPEDATADGYRGELATWQLITEVQRLLAEERRAERLVCRYLADFADRVRQRRDVTLLFYADELQAMRSFFGLGVREARERLRVGRALRDLPLVEQAFLAGELSYSRVREISRVAKPETEHEWLERAAQLDMRALERCVALEREGAGADVDAPAPDPVRPGKLAPSEARAPWQSDAPWQTSAADSSPRSLRVTFELSVEGWALLERALDGVRRAAGSELSDGEALAAVARDALSFQSAHRVSEPSTGEPSTVAPSAGGPSTGEPSTGEPSLRPPAATQSGSSGAGTATEVDREAEGTLATEPAELLLQIMGHRSGWTTDELMEASGLPIGELHCAMTLLEVSGLARRRLYAFDPLSREPANRERSRRVILAALGRWPAPS
ncbi:MAG: hypothetical protein ABI895_25760 [Deltaproteobacteria bacterium]